ncbi:hypothetical protein NDU88_003963 [Pleurodeles waltl]|uniref:Uncharacterized protein n=1 Tax=Pleurodeles waltl TaxID=8319 RepID=A0AAV7WWB7_PLEWA|nr:hypothetical protein NDU88_003963 [Pleurodeles waltl]
MLVGSVLPLRQRSIGREGGVRRRPGLLPALGAADEPLSRRRQRALEKPIIPFAVKSRKCDVVGDIYTSVQGRYSLMMVTMEADSWDL